MEIEGNTIRLSPDETLYALLAAPNDDVYNHLLARFDKFMADRDHAELTLQESRLPIIEIPYTKNLVELLTDAIRKGKAKDQATSEIFKNAKQSALNRLALAKQAEEYIKQRRNYEKLKFKVIKEE